MGMPRDERQKELFRPALDKIIDMRHPLVRLAGEIDWSFLEGRFGAVLPVWPWPAAFGGTAHCRALHPEVPA